MRNLTLIGLALLASPAANALTLSEAIEATLRHYPDAQAQRLAVEAAEAAQGPLWQRFIPGISGSAQFSSTTSESNFVATQINGETMSAQASLPLTPAGYYSWKIAAAQAGSARQQRTIVENQLAFRTVNAYTSIIVARDQLKILNQGFRSTLRKMSQDPEVLADAQLVDGVTALMTTVETQIINQESAQAIAEQQFEILTGLAPEKLVSSEHFDDELPIFPTVEAALSAALAGSPTLKASGYAVELSKNALRSTPWNYLRPNIGYGPSFSQQTLPNIASTSTTNGVVSGGLSITLDAFGYARARKSARLSYEQAKQTQAGATQSVRLQIETSYIQYRQQVRTVCYLRPQFQRIFEGFGKLTRAIQTGEDYSRVLVLTAFPQALSSIAQLYGSEISAMNAIANLHAQVGDLNRPRDWDYAENPKPDELCEKVLNLRN